MNESTNNLKEERRNLPIHDAKARLIQEVKQHWSVVVIGETGSGKTTQIPQYLLENGLHHHSCIAITQPRRVAAISMANRVAQEKGCDVGKLVGYCVRFDDVSSEQTKIRYMTDGMLLREAILDPLLKRYSVVILDEAHERTIHTDVLFGVVKSAQKARLRLQPRLRIIVMSATMDVDQFSQYFNESPVLYIQGRQHTVEVMYSKEEQSDYLFASIVTVFQLHRSKPPDEDILVFLSGQEEIESAVRTIRDIAHDLPNDLPPLTVLPLYSALPSQQQLNIFTVLPKITSVAVHIVIVKIFSTVRPSCSTVTGVTAVRFQPIPQNPDDFPDLSSVEFVLRSSLSRGNMCSEIDVYRTFQHLKVPNVFDALPKGTRKVIVSTNVAETSLTIHRIKYVIDSGRVKAKAYNPQSGLDFLQVVKISKAQAAQRTGRAGREAPGVCYRLYTEAEFDKMAENTIPEILRCNLSSVLLQLLALGVPDIANFDFMDTPSPEAVKEAMKQLCLLGAIKDMETCQLTDIGCKMSAFPLEPRLSKVLLASQDFKCLEEVLSIVALLSGDSVLYSPLSKREEAVEARRKFASSLGDHLTLLNMYRAFKGVSQNKQWCHEHFINQRNMKRAIEIRKQLRDICIHQGLTIESCGQDKTPVRKCFTQGFFMNAAEIQKDGGYISLTSKKKVHIHPSSTLHNCRPEYIIYNELVHTNKPFMRDLCVVDPNWLYETAPNFFTHKSAHS